MSLLLLTQDYFRNRDTLHLGKDGTEEAGLSVSKFLNGGAFWPQGWLPQPAAQRHQLQLGERALNMQEHAGSGIATG